MLEGHLADVESAEVVVLAPQVGDDVHARAEGRSFEAGSAGVEVVAGVVVVPGKFETELFGVVLAGPVVLDPDPAVEPFATVEVTAFGAKLIANEVVVE